jgi:hypothetical protein
VGARAAALVPALQELERVVTTARQGVEVQMVQSLSTTLVLLAKVRHWEPAAGRGSRCWAKAAFIGAASPKGPHGALLLCCR